jgi:hypothetical protein
MPCPSYPLWHAGVIIQGEEYKLWSPSLWRYIKPRPVSSSFVTVMHWAAGSQIYSVYISSLMSEPKLHNHT